MKRNQQSAISNQQKRLLVWLAAGCWLLAAVSGCTALTRLERVAVPKMTERPATVPDDGYHDYVGVMHVHTNYSHDAHGKFEDVVHVANGQHLDYVIITEHNTLRGLREGKQGWHGTTLVLIGVEISTRDGHYLSLNVHDEIDRTKLTTQQIIDEVNRQGGFGFIAHPYFKHGRWRNWSVTGFTGIEAYNVAHDTLDENKVRLALWTLTAPVEPFYLSILDRPYDPLAKWDELIKQRGKIVGIGSTDAHEFHAFGLVFAPYEIMFRLVRTHVLIPNGTSLTDQAVYDALRKGHAYLAIELLAEAKGFTFLAENRERVVGVMGDEVDLESGLQLIASLPMPAQVTLFHDGQPIATTNESLWHFPVTQSGAYRLEATYQGKPWIFSNPIYVKSLPTSHESSPVVVGQPAPTPITSTPASSTLSTTPAAPLKSQSQSP